MPRTAKTVRSSMMPVRPSRATRSQSRDVSVEPAPASAPARTTRQTRASRQDSVDSNVSNASRGKRNTRKNAQQQAVQELEPVIEQPAVEELPLKDTLEDEAELPSDPRQLGGSQGAPSISGTTARSTYSHNELAEMDPDLMADLLPDLDFSAGQVLKLIVPNDATVASISTRIGELSTASSSVSKRFALRSSTFTAQRASFGTQEYLRPDLILRSLLQVDSTAEIPMGKWRPDDLIYKANLATLATRIGTMRLDSPEIESVVESLDMTFPSQFASSLVTPGDEAGPLGKTHLLRETIHVALELRTQLALLSLSAHSRDASIDPENIVARIFMEVESDEPVGLEFARRTFAPRGGSLWEMLPEEERAQFEADLTDRLAVLHDYFKDTDSGDEAVEALGLEFSWEALQFSMIEWVAMRSQEIEENIADRGGVAEIAENLILEVERRRTKPRTPKSALKSTAATAASGTPSRRGIARLKAREQRLSGNVAPQDTAVRGIARLKAREQRLSGTVASPDTAAQPATGVVDDDDWHLVDEGDIAEPEIEPMDEENEKRAHVLRINRGLGHNKENLQQSKGKAPEARRFIDRQPNAQRVHFDGEDSQSQPQQTQTPFVAPHSHQISSQAIASSSKRSHADIIDNPSDDEGFQADTRPSHAYQRRREAPPTSRRTPPPPTRATTSPSPSPARQRIGTLPSQSPKRPRKNPGQAIEPYQPGASALPPTHSADAAAADDDDGTPAPPSTAVEAYKQAQFVAKMASRNLGAKGVQVRRPWDEAEMGALLDYIEAHGPAYAEIKRIDRAGPALLTLRDPEALRFKARNMKMDFLKSGTPLPPNWDGVALKASEIEKLLSMGIEYQQAGTRNVRPRYD